jgi:hypothetical protein
MAPPHEATYNTAIVRSDRIRLAVVLVAALVLTVATFLLPRIRQDPAYHAFADTRTIGGIANFWNVVSNAGFVSVGLVGLLWAFRHGRPSAHGPIGAWWEAAAIFIFAGGTLLTGVGSTFYHLAPDSGRLVWDRLPMTLVFMTLFALVIGDRVGSAAGFWLLSPLLTIGIASVLMWDWSERAGRGDLRLYALVQFLPMVIVPLLLVLMPARWTGAGWLWSALALNAIGKVAEFADARLLAWSGLISGHTAKHVLMAGATALVLRMLAARRPQMSTQDPALGVSTQRSYA